MKPSIGLNRAWVLLKSGRRLDILDPHPHSWTDEDLATGLSRTYRWGGHSKWSLPLSVAQHSLTVLHIRALLADRPLTPAEQLRELAHDMDEGLLGYDAITPLKPHLGEGYDRVVKRLRRAITLRYDLQPWDRLSHEAHKRADQIAAASEAHHVVGWSTADIRHSLGITIDPLDEDPVQPPTGMSSWEPWPPTLAAGLFLDRLHELLAAVSGMPGVDLMEVIDPTRTQHDPASPPPGLPTFVVVESDDGQQVVEGQVVKGFRGEDGAWDFESPFTVQTDDGLVKVNGWCCTTEIVR